MSYKSMPYEPLSKLYYKTPEQYESAYDRRFHAPSTVHLDTAIQEIGRQRAYPAFFCYTPSMVSLLTDIYKGCFQLRQFIERHVPAALMEHAVFSSIVDEVKSTNDIEGVFSTRREISEALQSLKQKKKGKRFHSIVSKYAMLTSSEPIPFASCADIRRFYDEFALPEVCAEDPDNAPDGEVFRRGPVSIGSPTGKDIHRGLMPEAAILREMDTALHILHHDELPRVIGIAVFHYLFGYIHPFYDGNGRTSRFITSYYLSREFDLPILGVRLSAAIKKDLPRYYMLFEAANKELNRGELTFFIEGFLDIVRQSAADSLVLLQEKIEGLMKFQQRLNDTLQASASSPDELTQRIYFILLQAAIFQTGGATIQEIAATAEKSRNTIDSRIAQIPASHYIKDTSVKPYRYRLNLLFLK